MAKEKGLFGAIFIELPSAKQRRVWHKSKFHMLDKQTAKQWFISKSSIRANIFHFYRDYELLFITINGTSRLLLFIKIYYIFA